MATETVRVIAPATLQAGYSFEASVDGKSFIVVVPDGGVKEGQEFEVPYPHNNHDDDSSDDSNDAISTVIQQGRQDAENDEHCFLEDEFGVPTGRWRTDLCSCCDVVMQSTFWLAFCCPPIIAAQLLTRLNLTWNAKEGPPEETSLTYNRVVLVYICVLWIGLIPLLGYVTTLLFFIFMIYVGMKLRTYMRHHYRIRPSCSFLTTCTPWGEQVDDCCCMVFCSFCNFVQMSRHTHNDKEYPGYACTTNGLEYGAPNIV